MDLLMSRKKDRVLYQHRFNLSSDSAAQQRLHDFLDEKAEHDEASKWMISVLVAALPEKKIGTLVDEGEGEDEENGE